MMTVPSLAADARRLPPGDQAIRLMSRVCPVRMRRSDAPDSNSVGAVFRMLRIDRFLCVFFCTPNIYIIPRQRTTLDKRAIECFWISYKPQIYFVEFAIFLVVSTLLHLS